MKKIVVRFAKANKNLFDAIAGGAKTVETRAATKKYRAAAPGDVLVFSCDGQKFERHVQRVRRFDSPASLFKTIPYQLVNPMAKSLPAAIETYNAFPGYQKKIAEFGLIAFDL